MRQRHFAGEKLFVDYAGRTVPIYGAACGEAFRAALFVGALGASGYVYAEATRTASLPDWLGSHVRMLEFCGVIRNLIFDENGRFENRRLLRHFFFRQIMFIVLFIRIVGPELQATLQPGDTCSDRVVRGQPR